METFGGARYAAAFRDLRHTSRIRPRMNEAVLKTYTISVIALAVSSALWLADSVQATQKSAPSRFANAPKPQAATPRQTPMLLAVALPAERAASAALTRTVGVR
jgi:hypothetical protein